MGTISSYFAREKRILILGLDGSGKTTFFYNVSKESDIVAPIVACDVKRAKYKNLDLTELQSLNYNSIPYGKTMVSLYLDGIDGLIYVVDCNDHEMMDESVEMFTDLMGNEKICDVSVLLVGNKQDLPNAIGGVELCEKFGLSGCKDRVWYVQCTCSKTGEGVFEGLDWICDSL